MKSDKPVRFIHDDNILQQNSDKERGKYMAKANRFGKNFIGRYDTIQDAENAYLRVKSEHITSLIPTIEDDYPKLVEPLKRIAKELMQNTQSD